MKKLIFTIGLGFLLLGLTNSSFAVTTQVDSLIEKLVEKGILDRKEATKLKSEIAEDEKIAREEGLKKSLPSWVRETKLKGDLRLRYQYLHESAPPEDANIVRIRVRLGLESKVNDKLNVGIGIATGSGDPRSTTITFDGYNVKKDIVLDYAYAKYSPLPWLNLVGGKMLLHDLLWEPTDLIWDTDITPEGAVIQFDKKLGTNTAVFIRAGAFIVNADTNTYTEVPMAYLIQPVISYKFNDDFSLKGAFSFQSFDSVRNRAVSTYSKGQNSKTGSNYKYDYQMINPALELSVRGPFRAIGLNVEKLQLFGEYVKNLDVSDGGSGFSLGFQVGDDKVEKWGDWQFKYIYAMLGKDAVLDILPDSDRLSGKTGMRSHKGVFSFGLAKNTFLGVNVFRSWSLVGAKAPETLGQADWNMKF
ncbi:MAG: putative porin [Nitrospirae bacterium]|nr:putative porin [Nitrospirota bacterium]